MSQREERGKYSGTGDPRLAAVITMRTLDGIVRDNSGVLLCIGSMTTRTGVDGQLGSEDLGSGEGMVSFNDVGRALSVRRPHIFCGVSISVNKLILCI